MRSALHQRMRYFYIRERNYINTGLAQIGWFRQFVELYFLIMLWFVTKGRPTPHYILLPLFFFMCFLLRWIGWLWDKMHLFEEEAEFGNRRNPAIVALLGRFK